jgi:hypothetical protein
MNLPLGAHLYSISFGSSNPSCTVFGGGSPGFFGVFDSLMDGYEWAIGGRRAGARTSSWLCVPSGYRTHDKKRDDSIEWSMET